MSVTLGSIIIDLVATETGEIQVASRVEGTIQYVTGMGMLAMAMQDLDEMIKEQD